MAFGFVMGGVRSTEQTPYSFLSNLALIIYIGVFPCRTLYEETDTLHVICPTSSGSEMPLCVLGQLM